jgi:thiol-disulfide isomerase/thioredoxin
MLFLLMEAQVTNTPNRPLLIAIGLGALLVIVGLVVFLFLNGGEQSSTSNPNSQKQATAAREATSSSEIDRSTFKGEVLAGRGSPLLTFEKEDYERALSTDKLIVLYFYANWCPICREEFPKVEQVFDELESDRVIGFRVNYNDSETEDAEVELAREFGVAYQHTKVFLKAGQRVLKSPESWQKDRYVSEINKALE